MKKESGFTLIEAMIVVAIIGILIAIFLPKFSELGAKSRVVAYQNAVIEAKKEGLPIPEKSDKVVQAEQALARQMETSASAPLPLLDGWAKDLSMRDFIAIQIYSAGIARGLIGIDRAWAYREADEYINGK